MSTNPPQSQPRQPGLESEMEPPPKATAEARAGAGRLDGKCALITGGDSGIGRAVAVLFAREGADVAVAYLDEHDDARETARLVEQEGARCILLTEDIRDEQACTRLVEEAVTQLGGLDVLVNNAAEQHVRQDITEISAEQLETTFRTNVFSMFHIIKAALAHLPTGGAIVNSTSVAAYQGMPVLIDYSATKGAIVALTRSLAKSLTPRGIRVNAVAPGPIWTPLIPASFSDEQVEGFGGSTPMGRPGEPEEVAPSYLFLASADASYMAGQVLHPNGGQIVNG